MDIEAAETEAADTEGADDDLQARVDEILSGTLDETAYQEHRQCIGANSYERIELVGDVGVVFYGRGDRAWFNAWASGRKCGGHRFERTTKVVDRRSSRLCELDGIRFVRDLRSQHIGPKCLLGKFQPISKAHAELLETTAKDLPSRP